MVFNASIEGENDFRKFAEAAEDASNEVHQVYDDAAVQTAKDYIDAVTDLIKARNTAKGGTLDSRTSPYSPGGENDSTGDSFHIADNEAWVDEQVGPGTVAVYPRQEVEQRAKWLEAGTSSHEPDGDNPYYFYVNGVKILVTEPPTDEVDYTNWTSAYASDETSDIEASAKYADPGEVDGVDRQDFFKDAAIRIISQNTFEENLENETEKLFDRHFGEL